eukprot:scaffold14926_cov60-Phaeocystis_antarctica.AAC.1
MPLGHARAPHTRTPHILPRIRTARDLVRCTLWCVAVLVVRGGREARPEQAASREARPKPAGSLSRTEVSPHPYGCKPPLCSSFVRRASHSFRYSHRMWSAPQVIRPRLIKWLATFCVLEYVGAVVPSTTPVIDILKMESAPEMGSS